MRTTIKAIVRHMVPPAKFQGDLIVPCREAWQVEVDVRGRVATVAGGALAGDVVAAAGPRALAAI